MLYEVITIAMSSLGSVRAMPAYGFIGASKAALESLVRSLAHRITSYNVCYTKLLRAHTR